MCADIGKTEIPELPVVNGTSPASTAQVDCFSRDPLTSNVASIVQKMLSDFTVQQNQERLISLIAKRLHASRKSGDLVNAVQSELEECLRLETQFREKELLYQQIVEMAGEGIWVIDDRAMTTFVNPRMAKLLGYSVAEMLGKPLFLFLDGEGEAIYHQLLNHRPQSIQERHECKFLHKDGSVVWTLVSKSPIFGAEDQYQGILLMVTDISDRKQFEITLARLNQELELRIQESTQSLSESQGTLQEREEFLRSIYEGSDAPIWVVDVREDGTFYQGGINPKTEQFLGMKAEDLLGKDLMDIFGPVQGAEIYALFSQCVTVGTPVTYEEKRHFQGQDYWLSTTLTPLRNGTGTIYRLVGHSLDITARKEAEIQQQQHVIELSKWQNRYEAAGEASG
jgi:two-component system, NtrC family, sensor kinase